jgi:sigma-B regulation protein RsbU (phosphoserine phosphatase)
MNSNWIKSLENQVLNREFMLQSLLEITRAINLNKSKEEIIDLFRFIIREQLGYKSAALFVKEEKWKCPIKYGVKAKWIAFDVEEELSRFREITEIVSSNSTILNNFHFVIPVYHKKKNLAYLLLSENSRTLEGNNLGDSLMNFIQSITNIIVVANENRRMARQGIVQERLSRELEVASAIQKYLFPSDLPSDRKMDVSARYSPRHEVGGDYYDFIPLGDDEYVICIADVSGKGIGAAMLMANFQAIVRTIFSYNRFDFHILMDELNHKVAKIAKGQHFITCFMAHYNAATRELRYVNAGHNHPFITDGRKAAFLSEGCTGLGMLEEFPSFSIGKKQLKPNTTLVLYTDGVVELGNREDEQFGVERLLRIIHGFYPLKMEDLNNLVFSKLDEWREGQAFVDDTAIFCCRFF